MYLIGIFVPQVKTFPELEKLSARHIPFEGEPVFAKINLIYDSRQQAAQKLAQLGIVIGDDKATYDLLEAKYDSLFASYNQQKQAFDTMAAAYQSGAAGAEIDIYEFDDRNKLVRVLAHELGHALGLNHVKNPKAIMYELNQGVNETLTQDDLTELNARCGIKNI